MPRDHDGGALVWQAELQALLDAYEAHLATWRLADAAAVYQEALHHLDVCPVRPDDLTLRRSRRPGARALSNAKPSRRLDRPASGGGPVRRGQVYAAR